MLHKRKFYLGDVGIPSTNWNDSNCRSLTPAVPILGYRVRIWDRGICSPGDGCQHGGGALGCAVLIENMSVGE